VVAIAGGITQIFRPGHRATERAALAAQLREEGWAFANRSGSYRDDDEAAFELLDQRISEIHRRASQIAAYDDTALHAAQRDASRAKRTSAQRGHPVR
jgi:hypothetical protein